MFCDFGVSSSLYFLRKCFSGGAPLSLYLMDGIVRIAKYWAIALFFTLLFLLPLVIHILPVVSQKTEYNLGTVIQYTFS